MRSRSTPIRDDDVVVGIAAGEYIMIILIDVCVLGVVDK